jgi:uncharacterized protein YndB with AHSA1/START domain
MSKVKIHLEFLLNDTAKNILWSAISTVAGLENWFAEKIISDDKIVTFQWAANETKTAEIVAVRAYSFIRFHWLDDKDPHTYFELKMSQDELTNAFVLEINDFVNPDEVDDMKELWTSEVAKMRRVWGF